MATYYNEHDPKAAAWLRELIRGGHIPDGWVDERSICDVSPHELTGYVQQHFFAGIGGWAFALRLAGYGDDRPVRTGSCPCQPFSDAGNRLGEKDPRHLWPWFRDLITFGEATVTFGEQVASKAGRDWLAGIRTDLEGLGYEVGAADLCSAGAGEVGEGWIVRGSGDPQRERIVLGAPHIRQRLFWVAHAGSIGCKRGAHTSRPTREGPKERCEGVPDIECGRLPSRLADPHGGECGHGALQRGGQHGQLAQNGGAGRMGDAGSEGSGRDSGAVSGAQGEGARGGRGVGRVADESIDASAAGGMGNATLERLQERVGVGGVPSEAQRTHARKGACGSGSMGFWSDFELLPCTDGKARRIEPGTFPLAHGVSGRVGLLRGYGNAINPWLAADFIQACDEALNGR